MLKGGICPWPLPYYICLYIPLSLQFPLKGNTQNLWNAKVIVRNDCGCGQRSWLGFLLCRRTHLLILHSNNACTFIPPNMQNGSISRQLLTLSCETPNYSEIIVHHARVSAFLSCSMPGPGPRVAGTEDLLSSLNSCWDFRVGISGERSPAVESYRSTSRSCLSPECRPTEAVGCCCTPSQ